MACYIEYTKPHVFVWNEESTNGNGEEIVEETYWY